MRTVRDIPLLVLLLLQMQLTVMSCAGPRRDRTESDTTRTYPVSDITAEAVQWADSVAAGMDTLRMAAQLVMPAVYSSDDLWTMRQVVGYARRGIGGIVLLKGTADQARTLADSIARYSSVMPFIAIDAEWGLNMRLADAPRFPANGELSPAVRDQLMYDYGREVARECRQLGINMVLGPVLDVCAENSFLGIRSFGADPRRVAELGTAYGRGLADGDVIAVAKHFPGHGSVSSDSHRDKGVIGASLSRLDSVDLLPFKEWIASRMPAIMVGHLAVPAIDSRMLPAAVSPVVIGDLLRRDMQFDGIVLTDAMNMLGAEGHSAAQAISAGADIILAPSDTEQAMRDIVAAVHDSVISMPSLRQHVQRVLFYKYLIASPRECAGQLATPYTDSIRASLRRGTSSSRRP